MSNKYPWLNRNNILSFVVFLIISTGLWLLIKLSEQFTTQASFGIKLIEAPASQQLTSGETQTVKFSLQANGFKTLGCRLLRDSKRSVWVSLDEVPFRTETGNTYSFSSQYVAEKIAELLRVNASDISMNDDKVYFVMEAMVSKVVPVVLRSNIRTQQRYEVYGLPILEPATITVFGPKNVLDTLNSVSTRLLSKSSVNATVEEMVALDLHSGLLRCENTEVKATIEVLQYTEQVLQLPVSSPDSLKIRFFPETVKVKFVVPLKDYPSMSPDLFKLEVDPAQADGVQTLLDVRLSKQPGNIKLLSIDPQRVEYLIVE